MQAPYARWLWVALAGTLWVLALTATAAEPIPGQTVESVRTWLIERNPELRALGLEAEAAEARIQPAGALPDPSASIIFRGPDAPWRRADGGREIDYALRQRFPLWGKRELARTAARHEAVAANLARGAAARDLMADAEAAYVRYWHADEAVAVLDRRIALLRQIEEMAGVRYALGRTAQQDAIRAQVEQTTLQRERIERTAAKHVAIAELNALLGREPNAPLAPPAEIPAMHVLSPELDTVLERLDTHPAVAAALAAMSIGFIAGRSGTPDPAESGSAAPAAEREILYYRNPMGLADTSPVPKKDSMGMDYVPVYAGEAPPSTPGTVVMSPDRVQSLGVRTEAVRSGPLMVQVRTSGTIEVDETRQYAVAPRFEGWVERLYANQTGMRVRAGQPLLAVYSPQLAAAQQEYRLADETTRKLAESDPVGAASMARLRDAARTRLRNWEIQDVQIGHGGSGTHNMILTSPVDGVVTEKAIVQGARFEPGETVLRLADLSTVWLVAKVPAAQAANITVGQPARFESVALPGDTFDGAVTFVQPVLDAQTRTVDVRVALPNPGGLLRPGLFGTVQLQDPSAQPVLTVPRSAILDSGLRQIVLVQDGPGRFAPREVTLGRRGGDRVEILEGLAAGEAVVVSANFLIDAESNLQAALQSMTGHGDHGVAPADGDHAHGEHAHGAMDGSHPNDDHGAHSQHGPPDHENHEELGDHIDHGPHDEHSGHGEH